MGTETPIEIGLLNKTGFNAPLAVKSLNRKYQHNLTQGLPAADAIAMPLNEAVGDIIGYKHEYVAQESWLCSPLTVKSYRGRERLFNCFSNQPISEGITREERLGAVADSMEAIEPYLLSAKNKSRAVMYSPAGWSGMKDQQGRTIKYTDAQICFFEKDENGNYQSNTLVMDDFDSDQVKRFYAVMGYPHPVWNSPFLSEQEQVAEAVRNVIYLPNTDETFESIVKKVQRIKGTDIVRHLSNGELRTFDEVYQKMKRGNDLLNTDDSTQAQIDSFKRFVLNNKDSMDLEFTQKRIQQELEHTVLNISRIVKGEAPVQINDFIANRAFFQKDITYLEERGGCNGGGSDIIQILVQSALGSRVGEVSAGDAGKSKWCSNARCKEENICNDQFCYKCGSQLTDQKAA